MKKETISVGSNLYGNSNWLTLDATDQDVTFGGITTRFNITNGVEDDLTYVKSVFNFI